MHQLLCQVKCTWLSTSLCSLIPNSVLVAGSHDLVLLLLKDISQILLQLLDLLLLLHNFLLQQDVFIHKLRI